MAYRSLDPEDIVLSTEMVSSPVWTGNVPNISKEDLHFNVQQKGSLSGLYYLDIYKYVDSEKTGSLDSDEVQFSIAYGDRDGSGSTYYNKDAKYNTYSRTIYGQYRTLVLGDEDSDFYLTEVDSPSSNFIALTIDRARYKEKLMLGTVRLVLQNGTVLVDNSRFGGTVKYVDSGRLYKLVEEGDLEGYKTYGFFLPDIGIILLDCKAIGMTDTEIRWDPWKEDSGVSQKDSNMQIFFDRYFQSFEVQAEETITSNYVFVRARNSEFNYSTNPSNITGSGELRHDIMINQPQVYITSVGLYNNNNDLLAVAKLSRPLLKDFTKEAIIRIKIDY